MKYALVEIVDNIVRSVEVSSSEKKLIKKAEKIAIVNGYKKCPGLEDKNEWGDESWSSQIVVTEVN